MYITNPTGYELRKIHSFEIHNRDRKERYQIDVLDPMGEKDAKFVAIPHLLGYHADESVVGRGDTIEAALNECLRKIAGFTWEELETKVNPRLKR